MNQDKKHFCKKLTWRLFLTLLLIFFLWFYLQYKWNRIRSIRDRVFGNPVEKILDKAEGKLQKENTIEK